MYLPFLVNYSVELDPDCLDIAQMSNLAQEEILLRKVKLVKQQALLELLYGVDCFKPQWALAILTF